MQVRAESLKPVTSVGPKCFGRRDNAQWHLALGTHGTWLMVLINHESHQSAGILHFVYPLGDSHLWGKTLERLSSSVAVTPDGFHKMFLLQEDFEREHSSLDNLGGDSQAPNWLGMCKTILCAMFSKSTRPEILTFGFLGPLLENVV